MNKSTLLIAFVLILVSIVIESLHFGGELTPVPSVNVSDCRRFNDKNHTAVGLEDGDWVDPAHGSHQIWTSDDRVTYYGKSLAHLPYRSRIAAKQTLGSLLLIVDHGDEGMQLTRCELTNFGSRHFHPHGLSIVKVHDSIFIYVVNHTPQGDSIELFRITSVEPNCELEYLESIRNHQYFLELNDIAGINQDEFYVTNDFSDALGTIKRTISSFARLSKGSITHCKRIRINNELIKPWECIFVSEQLKYPNGINILNNNHNSLNNILNPMNGNYLFVSEILRKQIVIYERNMNTGELIRIGIIPTPFFALDNILIDYHTGDLIIAGHPKMLQFLIHTNSMNLTHPSPSMVIRIKILEYPKSVFPINNNENNNNNNNNGNNEKSDSKRYKVGQSAIMEFENRIIPHEIRLIHSNDGNQFSASSTALIRDKRVYIGGVFTKDMLICEFEETPVIESNWWSYKLRWIRE